MTRNLAAIKTADLSKVKRRVIKELNWTSEYAESAVQEYRKFICLAAHGFPAVPCRDVDEVWHNHILFTQDYTTFCDDIFGFYLHHDPMDSSETVVPVQQKNATGAVENVTGSPHDAYSQTLEMYVKVFGTKPDAMWGSHSADTAALCFARNTDSNAEKAALCFARNTDSSAEKAALCFARNTDSSAEKAALCFARNTDSSAEKVAICIPLHQTASATKERTLRVDTQIEDLPPMFVKNASLHANVGSETPHFTHNAPLSVQ
eukprot:ANDGO_06237.mRNA.1 hypothetical protein TTHERM_00348080